MEMCYDGALVMPSSYAMMNEEEMMYLEGGVNVNTAAYYAVQIGVDAAVCGVFGGGSIKLVGQVIKQIGKKGLKKALKTALQKWVAAKWANRIVASILPGVCEALSTTVGTVAANYLDRLDGNVNQQICFRDIIRIV